MVTEDWTLGGKYTMQYTDDILQTYTLETHIILLTNVTPINLIVFFKDGIQKSKLQYTKNKEFIQLINNFPAGKLGTVVKSQ